MGGLDLSKLRDANVRRNAEWDPEGKLTLTFRATELAGEIGEACNVIKKLERERLGLRGSRATPEDLAEELADGVICIDLAAMAAGVDLSAAVIAKFNAGSAKNGLSVLLEKSGEGIEAELLDFVKDFAKKDPVFAKGHEKERIRTARELVAKAEVRA